MFWVYKVLLDKYKIIFITMSFGFVSFSWGYDPMAPPGVQSYKPSNKKITNEKPVQPSYVLRQIVIRENDNKSAVINGYVLNEGGYLKGALVKNIYANKVILDVAGKERILYLKPNVARVRK